VQTGELAYPIKYEFSDRVDYCSKRSAASQHPPLLPLAAGLLGWAIGSDLTYPLLKILSELGGMILVLTVVARVSSCGGPGTLLALALVAGSPALVDFSGNGSPYVWSGLLLLASTLLVPRVAAGRTRDFAATGLLSGVAPQIHFALLAIPVSFVLSGLIRWRRLSVGPVLAFCGAAAVVTAPWVAWNLRHFGAPWYSYAPSVFWTNLGLAREGIHGDVVTWWWKDASWLDMASVALRNTYGSTPAGRSCWPSSQR